MDDMTKKAARADRGPSYGSSTVEKAIDVLVAVSSSRGGLSNVEISEQLDLDRSTTHRLVTTLERRGLVLRGDDRKFTGGPFLHQLAFGSPLDLRTTLSGILGRLVETTGESATFSIPQGDRYFCVVDMPSPHDLRYCPAAGSDYALNSGAAGLAIWAFLPRASRKRLLEEGDLPAYTEATITDRTQLLAELEATRERGYAISAGARTPGGCAIACPVLSHQGSLLGAIAISAAEVRVPRESLVDFVPGLQTAAQAITDRLGVSDA